MISSHAGFTISVYWSEVILRGLPTRFHVWKKG